MSSPRVGRHRAMRDPRKKLHPPSRASVGTRGLRCYFCGGTIARAKDGAVEFAASEIGPPFLHPPLTRFNEHGGREEVGRLVWPGCSDSMAGEWQMRGFFSHYGCPEQDLGLYWFPLERLDEDIENHLARKRWWVSSFEDLIHAARTRLGMKITKHVNDYPR